MNIFGPSNAAEGQHIELHTVFSITCSSGGYYLIRADLVDGRTAQVLSTNRTQFAILGPFFAELTNEVAVPQITGWWSLQVNLYVLDGNGVPVAPQSQQIFGLAINPYNPTT
jgi:hypothetical protein